MMPPVGSCSGVILTNLGPTFLRRGSGPGPDLPSLYVAVRISSPLRNDRTSFSKDRNRATETVIPCGLVEIMPVSGTGVGVGRGVDVGRRVGVGDGVVVALGVGVTVGVGVAARTGVRVIAGVGVGVGDGVDVRAMAGAGVVTELACGAAVEEAVGVGVGVGVGLGATVGTGVGTRLTCGAAVGDGVGVGVRSAVGVAIALAATREAVGGSAGSASQAIASRKARASAINTAGFMRSTPCWADCSGGIVGRQ